jgi:hypothetical protein
MKDIRIKQDKFIYFCRRIITKKTYKEKYPNLLWELLTFLMHINHAYYYLYVYASKKVKRKLSDNVLKIQEDAIEYFSFYYDAFFKKDVKAIYKLNELKSKLHFGKCYDLIEKSKGPEAVVLSKIREILRLIQIGGSPIYSIILG